MEASRHGETACDEHSDGRYGAAGCERFGADSRPGPGLCAVERGDVVGAQAGDGQRRAGMDRRACSAQDSGGAEVDWLRARLAEGDFTPRGLVVELAGPGLRVDDRKMWAFAQVVGLGLRKRRRWPVSRSDRTLPANARAGRCVRAASTPNGLSSPKPLVFIDET